FVSIENRRNAIGFEPTPDVSQLGEFGRQASLASCWQQVAALHFEPRPHVDTITANWDSSRSHKLWRGSQVVRSRSAKPLFAGAIPAPAFLKCWFTLLKKLRLSQKRIAKSQNKGEKDPARRREPTFSGDTAVTLAP